MAETGEVVYTEVDFAIPGQGFDFVWSRTYRSAREFEGWVGYGWSFSAELYMVEVGLSGDVYPQLGDGRIGEYYEENSGVYTSPDGYWDALTKGTRSSGHTPAVYASEPFFTKTEKNGVVWEFDRAIDGASKDTFVCTSITDTWGNEITFEYDSSEPMCLDTITDTEGREVTFTYHTTGGLKDLITNVTVSDSSIHADYGNISIDYSYDYATGTLSKVEKHKTRQVAAGTVVRPYTEYTYDTSLGYKDKNLLKVFYSENHSTGDPSYEFKYNADAEDRCYEVIDADGEVHKYLHDQGDATNGFYVKYTDPSNQRRDFVHEDYSGGDLTVAEVREYLEDEDGTDLSGHYDLIITRDCDCGQITGVEYPDGSKELWTYDYNGNVTKYTRTSAGTEPDLVKAWTYDTVANYSRMLTSSGWLRAEASPAAKVTYTWDGDGGLNTVTLPTVTTGVPSAQTIVYDYEIGSDGVLDWFEDPEDNRTDYSFSGSTLTITLGAGSSETMASTISHDVMGNVSERTSYLDSAGNTEWVFTNTPDGRKLKAVGPAGQQMKWEYSLRGSRTKAQQLLAGTTWTTTLISVSLGGEVLQRKADDGGIDAISSFAMEEGESERYTEFLNPDDFGSRQQWGYGSYGLPWKTFYVDNSVTPKSVVRNLTLERDTMGRIAKRVMLGGTEISYLYDGFGRRTEVHEELPGGATRKTIATLTDWGGVEKIQKKVGSTELSVKDFFFDEALRIYKETNSDPTNSLSDREMEFEMDKAGRILVATDALGGESEVVYRADGRIRKRIGAEGNEEQYEYSDSSRTLTTTSHLKDTSTSSFEDYVTVSTLNVTGLTATIKDEGSSSGNLTTTFSYDLAGRETQRSSPGGKSTSFAYDALGRVTSVTKDIDGATEQTSKTYTWSPGGACTKVQINGGYYVERTYDYAGRELTYKLNGDTNQVTEKTYDSFGRLETVTFPEGNVWTYAYDSLGRPLTISYSLPLGSSLTGPARKIFVYDDMDRMTSAKTQSVSGGVYSDLTTVSRTYNGFGELSSETQNGGHTIELEYDDAGRLSELTYPAGGPIEGIRFTLDNIGRTTEIERKLATSVEGISSSSWETTASFEYEGSRELLRVQGEYDLERSQSWDSFRRPESLRYEVDSTDVLITGFTNTWSTGGKIVVRERDHDNDGTYGWGEVFRYDDLGRLTSSWNNVRNPDNYSSSNPSSNFDELIEWDLDKVHGRNNVKTTLEGESPTTKDYSLSGAYIYSAVESATANVTTDGNGNIESFAGSNYSWTSLGQLAAVGSSIDHTFDAFGRKVRRENGSEDSEFLYLGAHLIGEYDAGSDEWLWEEIPLHTGEGMLEHISIDLNDIDDDENDTEYRQYAVHEDWQNTVWAVSDTNGDLVEQYVQDDVFGLTHTLDRNESNIGTYATEIFHRKRMHGGVVDVDSELYDFRNRWYSPTSGSWLSRDPRRDLDSYNQYQAFLASPLTTTDQSGLYCYEQITKEISIRPPSGSSPFDILYFTTVAQIQLDEAQRNFYNPAKCDCCYIMVEFKIAPDEGGSDAVIQPQDPGFPGEFIEGFGNKNSGQSYFADMEPGVEPELVPDFEPWGGSGPPGSQWNIRGNGTGANHAAGSRTLAHELLHSLTIGKSRADGGYFHTQPKSGGGTGGWGTGEFGDQVQSPPGGFDGKGTCLLLSGFNDCQSDMCCGGRRPIRISSLGIMTRGYY